MQLLAFVYTGLLFINIHVGQRKDLALPVGLSRSKALATVMGLKCWSSYHG